MIKTVIIGSSGFIAPHLIKRLKKLGHSVTAFHHNDKVVVKDADYIFYTASYGNHYFQKDPQLTVKANIVDYLKLLNSTLPIKYKGLFYFSTSSVTLPVQTDYSNAKYIGELLGKRFFKKFHKPIVSIRPSSVYGEGEADFRFFPVIVKAAKSGTSMPFSEGYHDWIYISDFIDGLITALDNAQELSGRSVAIGTGKATANSEIIRLMGEIAGKRVKTHSSDSAKRVYDTKNWFADITQLKQLGWSPKVSLIDGLKKVYNYYE